jgi:DNA mismatch repair ATPase MutS
LSDETISEAKEMLKLLEKEHNETFWNQLSLGELFTTSIPQPLSRFPVQPSRLPENDIRGWHSGEKGEKESEIEKELEKIDVNNLTPIEALNELSKLKSKLNEK